eukprot:Nk52_evm7s307 gene=Nk52_evmTU7s307
MDDLIKSLEGSLDSLSTTTSGKSSCADAGAGRGVQAVVHEQGEESGNNGKDRKTWRERGEHKSARGKVASHRERMEKWLRLQQGRRTDVHNLARRIVEGDDDLEEEESEDERGEREGGKVDKEEEEIELRGRKRSLPHPYSESGKGASSTSGTAKKLKKNPYKGQLMMAEKLESLPMDLEGKWLVIACPVGKRCLVISSRGRTNVWLSNGHHFKCFQAILPGGCKRRGVPAGANVYCILDCIYEETSNVYFVADVMCWNGHPVYDSDAEFRTFWMKSKFSEWEAEHCSVARHFSGSQTQKILPEIYNYAASGNQMECYFIPLRRHGCSSGELRGMLKMKQPFWDYEKHNEEEEKEEEEAVNGRFHLDAYLLMHKESHYYRRRTPLCCWIKPSVFSELIT